MVLESGLKEPSKLSLTYSLRGGSHRSGGSPETRPRIGCILLEKSSDILISNNFGKNRGMVKNVVVPHIPYVPASCDYQTAMVWGGCVPEPISKVG